jgi:DNA-binding CsgD family transcriptional regulator
VRPDEPITVAVGQFGDVIGRGLLAILDGERGLRVVGSGLDRTALEGAVARGEAQVAILDEDSVGVAVCLSTDASAAELVRSIRLAAARGDAFVSMSAHPARPAARALGIYALTRRERQVLELLSRGRKHTEVAEALNVSTETARTHAKHIYHKLGVSSRKELLGIEP